VSENRLLRAGCGIRVGAGFCRVFGNSIFGCTDGIEIEESWSHNLVYENIIMNTSDICIRPRYSESTRIFNNSFANYFVGIWTTHNLAPSHIFQNSISNGCYGMILFDSQIVYGNDISNNTVSDIVLQAPQSSFFHNSFLSTIPLVLSYGFGGWDDGYPSGGNYWSNYNGTDYFRGSYQNLTGGDGIGDTPYRVDAYSVDNYPLMNPWTHHDVLLLKNEPCKALVGNGYPFCVNVTISNRGDHSENLDVSVYANTTLISAHVETILASGKSTTITVSCDSTGLLKGCHSITACACPVPGETNTVDNTLTEGIIYIVLAGDVNNDGKVDLKDVYAIARRYGRHPWEPLWDPSCDINDDQVIDLKDYFIVCKNFGKDS
jgi:parallel beta-helix repeat protein